MRALRGALIGGIAGATLAAATIALAGTGIGGVFNLGADNTVNKTTILRNTASFSGPSLQIKNTAGGTALDLQVKSGKPPMTVNSSAKVQNLNADFLDGIDASGFVQGKGAVLKSSWNVDPGITQGIASDAHFLVQYECPSDTGDNGGVFFANESPSSADLFVDNGGADPLYNALGPYPAAYDTGASAGGELNTFQAHWTDGTIATVSVASVHKSNPVFGAYWCHVDLQAVESR